MKVSMSKLSSECMGDCVHDVFFIFYAYRHAGS